jgi:hypothetical protein
MRRMEIKFNKSGRRLVVSITTKSIIRFIEELYSKLWMTCSEMCRCSMSPSATCCLSQRLLKRAHGARELSRERIVEVAAIDTAELTEGVLIHVVTPAALRIRHPVPELIPIPLVREIDPLRRHAPKSSQARVRGSPSLSGPTLARMKVRTTPFELANGTSRGVVAIRDSASQATTPMNWHAETNLAVTIVGGSIGGLCAGVALRAIGAVPSQTIEGFRTIWKRGVVGTFLKGSRKYLLLHVAEFSVPI